MKPNGIKDRFNKYDLYFFASVSWAAVWAVAAYQICDTRAGMAGAFIAIAFAGTCAAMSLIPLTHK